MTGRYTMSYGAVGAVNPAIVTGLIDLASTGVQVGAALSAGRQQRQAQQAVLEAQLRAQQAQAQAVAVAPKNNTNLLLGVGAVGFLLLVVGGAVILRRR